MAEREGAGDVADFEEEGDDADGLAGVVALEGVEEVEAIG